MSSRSLVTQVSKIPSTLRTGNTSSAAAQWVCRSCQRALGRRSYGLGKDRMRNLGSWNMPYASTHTRQNIRAFSATHFRSERPTEDKRTASNNGDGQPTATDGIQAAGDKLQKMLTVTRESWNELVGYTEIEKNRAKVAEQEDLIQTRKMELQVARETYRSAVDKHAGSLRETRDLLARKDDWSERDATRFATLHTTTKTDETAEQSARRELQVAELALERETERLSSRIGAVYQAESMYNSKVLQVKTWWTWALMAFNITVFLFNVYLIQLGLNPRYRRDIDLSDKAIAKIKAALSGLPVVTTSGDIEQEADVMSTIMLTQRGDDVESQEKQLSVVLSSSETIATVKSKLQEESGTPLSQLHLFFEGVELKDDARITDLASTDSKGIRLVFSTDGAPIVGTTEQPDVAKSKTSELLAVAQKRLGSLFSAAPVTLQTAELTTIVLQSATAGATLAALVAVAWQKR